MDTVSRVRDTGDLGSLAPFGTKPESARNGNLENALLTFPRRAGFHLRAQADHLARDFFGAAWLREIGLAVGDHRGIQEHSCEAAPAVFDDEDKRIVITLNLVDRIIVNEIAGAVDDRMTEVNFNAAKNVPRVAEHDVGL